MSDIEIRVTEVEQSPIGHGTLGKVVFEVRSKGGDLFEIPLYGSVDAADFIRVARHYLHDNLARCAEETAEWKLSDEELKELGVII
ncbi:hypothetical protein [Telmatospirillum sp.]|uniref:hypothetical protein n=1 Tax=Telmatospirillum sp. TaxID=2079197 RepID=UPI00284005A6|nr:hypothetical protein [Telmatospirillum sp.]MDR3438976.1 hypothetical protein [Telmatospirillum sp.]